jgi:hypothetical protein
MVLLRKKPNDGWTRGLNHNAALSDGAGGALWLPFYYLRRDATALGLLLLSMLDITSSFH